MSGRMKFKISLIIVLFLLIMAVIVYIITGLDTRREYYTVSQTEAVEDPTLQTTEPADYTQENSQPSIAVATPAPSAPVVLTPGPEDMPVATPEPTPTPAPSPTPEPVYGTTVGSGSFKSDTGSRMNIVTRWEAVTQDADHVSVRVTVSAQHYSLHMISNRNVFISFNGEYQAFECPAVDTDDNSLQETELASYTFSVSLGSGESKTMPLAVEWQFHGSYGDVDLDVIECGGDITLSR